MVDLKWINTSNTWTGECPVCGKSSYFNLVVTNNFPDDTTFDILQCPAGHAFVVSTKTGDFRLGDVNFVLPFGASVGIPDWLPEEYISTYGEMMVNYKMKHYRSSVALGGVILDAHINSLLKNPGERKKPLKQRLEVLVEHNKIDSDQFADSTIARLGRNVGIHPDDLGEPTSQDDAKEVIGAITSCLARFYQWRSAKALPAPEERVETEGK